MESLSSCLMLGGCPRSGTTALMMSLNSNPSIFISSEENLFAKLEQIQKVIGTRERQTTKARATLGSDAPVMRATSQRENWTLSDVHPYHFSASYAPDLITRLYHLQHASLHPGVELKLFGDKLPLYFRYLDRLAELPFPLRYIHITRNPYDVINSMLRRVAMTKLGKDWWKGFSQLDEMAEVWNEAFTGILKHEDRANVLHIQYEDMIFDTEATLERMKTFLDIECLDFNFPLITDKSQHFDRSYLDADAQAFVRERCDIAAYKAYLHRTGRGAASLQSLPVSR